jgi:DNA cross-link repair 1A protein
MMVGIVPVGAQEDGAPQVLQVDKLQTFLEERGVGNYADNFHRAGAGLDLLPVLTDADLQAMGVQTLGARKRILLGAAEMKKDQQAVAGDNNSSRQNAPNRSMSGNAPSSSSLICFFSKGGDEPKDALTALMERPPPQALERKVAAAGKPGGSAYSKPYKSGGWVHSDAVAAKRRRWGGGRAAAIIPFKSWQQVPGTNFLVDRFCNLPPSTPANKHWFLTHFHADHYKGLTSKFDRGIVYCTPVTAALVKLQLRVRPEFLREVPIGGNITIEGTRVTFLPANHCPGAAMLLFECPGMLPILHSGDCRLATTLLSQLPQLENIRGAVDLILDTTYCDPRYTFPTQAEALNFAVDAVKAESFNPKTLFLFGSYTIGKERLYLQAAKVLGSKIYVSATKKKILDCLDLDPDEAALLTTDDSETNLHAVPLWMVSQKHMANTLKFYRGRFTNIVGFQPTGWTHTRDTTSTKAGRRRQKGTLITYTVPYSEHSSFSELKEFVNWLRPTSIVPSVNNDGGGPKMQKMVSLLRS